MTTIGELLACCANGEGRIVSTGDLTEIQIADARKYGRIVVDNEGFGYVLLPWVCACCKDLMRDAPIGCAP